MRHGLFDIDGCWRRFFRNRGLCFDSGCSEEGRGGVLEDIGVIVDVSSERKRSGGEIIVSRGPGGGGFFLALSFFYVGV